MATPVIMPKFGMAQTEGTIIRWLKQAGDAVTKGETILEVQTDKIDMEVEATADGILTDVRFAADATIPVTTVIAYIAAAGEATPPEATLSAPLAPQAAPAGEHRASPVAQRMAAAAGIDLTQLTGSGPAGRIVKRDVADALTVTAASAVRATPAARRLARRLSIDLYTLAGSGPAGRIQAVDVTDAAQDRADAQASTPGAAPGAPETGEASIVSSGAPAPLSPARRGEPLRGRRRTIAARLAQSWQTIPHFFLTISVDLTQIDALTAILHEEVQQRGGRLTPTVWIARAVAAALPHHPRLNAWLQQDGEQWRFLPQPEVALGIAVAVDDGLLVPVVRDAGRLGLAALAQQIVEAAARARNNQLTPADVSGSTFTISNLGMYPVEQFTAIINPPEVAILAVGQAQLQPVWTGAAFAPRRLIHLTLSADHRVIDGAVAAAFLAEVKELLETPARLLL